MSLPGRVPDVDPSAWVADTARVVGAVTLGEQVSVWYSAVLRGDGDSITVGARTNLQDGAVLHADPGFPLVVGAGVSVGHATVLHGCTVEDDVLVGMGAVVMNGARIGTGSMIGAGALVSPGTVVPPGSLVVGTPGKVRRETTGQERELIALNATVYLDLVAQHRQATVV
ncbi:MAG: gamma carbonic anhydrase family protein [Frankiales bacterium]|nr:gamma carbonic anhydrase family protein [Frankiales bacterium]